MSGDLGDCYNIIFLLCYAITEIPFIPITETLCHNKKSYVPVSNIRCSIACAFNVGSNQSAHLRNLIKALVFSL